MPEVINMRPLGVSHVRDLDPGLVYIGRPSKWGNPFVIGVDGSRKEVIEKYREWLLLTPNLLRDLGELRGKDLVCWCAPQACHGDVLLEMAND